MEIYIMRHGTAVEREDWDGAEQERPLTRKGREELAAVVKAMRGMKLEFELILSTSLARAKETAEIVAKGLRRKSALSVSANLAPGGDPVKLVRELRKVHPDRESILLVGHEPDLSGLISLFLTGDSKMQTHLKKGGLCKLTMDRLEPGRCGTLEWLLTPKQMSRMI